MTKNLVVKEYNSKIKEQMPLAVFVFSDKINDFPKEAIKDEYIEKLYYKLIQDKQITGKAGENSYLYSLDSNFNKYCFLGIGDSKNIEEEDFRVAGSALCMRLRKLNIEKVAVKFPQLKDSERYDRYIQNFIEGFMLRNYDFYKYRQKSHEGKITELYLYQTDKKLKEKIETGLHKGAILSESTIFCRDIANEPANFMTPEIMAQRVLEIGKSNKKLKCKIFEKKDLEKLGMGCFLAVAQADSVPPKMIVMEYKQGGNKPFIALVGKGITFDSGGISLKNSSGMFHMKRDMSGAAAVISAMKALSELDLKINVVGIVGATENMPDANSYKPSDILTSMSGKTVEIINTDAEGRLVLADLLTYTQKTYKPKLIIDLATLTGAVQRALGGEMSGAFTNNKDLLSKVMNASKVANEPIWELPLEPKIYRGANKSYFADLKNSSDKPPGGTKAALFLYEFIENDLPWVHLDIAGTDTASGEPSSYYPRGATGVGTRTLAEFLINEAGE